MSASNYLDCDACGDVAVESEDGLFDETMSGPCMSCGVAGQVWVYDEGDIGTAEWVVVGE